MNRNEMLDLLGDIEQALDAFQTHTPEQGRAYILLWRQASILREKLYRHPY